MEYCSEVSVLDFPNLLARDRTCTFDWTVYPQFIRDSYFYRQFNLDSDPLQCGSSREVVDIGVADNGWYLSSELLLFS